VAIKAEKNRHCSFKGALRDLIVARTGDRRVRLDVSNCKPVQAINGPVRACGLELVDSKEDAFVSCPAVGVSPMSPGAFCVCRGFSPLATSRRSGVTVGLRGPRVVSMYIV